MPIINKYKDATELLKTYGTLSEHYIKFIIIGLTSILFPGFPSHEDQDPHAQAQWQYICMLHHVIVQVDVR